LADIPVLIESFHPAQLPSRQPKSLDLNQRMIGATTIKKHRWHVN
jgi:hypothetical protein